VAIRPVSFRNHRGLLLRGTVHIPTQYDTAVVFLHGFPGTMDGTAKRFCTALARQGYVCLRFDFSGSGTSEGRFDQKLMSEEVKDINAAITYMKKEYPTKQLILVGISTGAIDAALYAHTDKRVSSLVLLSGVSDLARSVNYDFTAWQVRDFWMKGYTYHIQKPWMKHKGKLWKAFYDEFFTLNIAQSLKQYHRPLLILHGEYDTAIPVQKDPYELFALARKPKQLVIIPRADHTFSKPLHQRKAIAAITTFIRAFSRRGDTNRRVRSRGTRSSTKTSQRTRRQVRPKANGRLSRVG
jgi:uncharacterized protein